MNFLFTCAHVLLVMLYTLNVVNGGTNTTQIATANSDSVITSTASSMSNFGIAVLMTLMCMICMSLLWCMFWICFDCKENTYYGLQEGLLHPENDSFNLENPRKSEIKEDEMVVRKL